MHLQGFFRRIHDDSLHLTQQRSRRSFDGRTTLPYSASCFSWKSKRKQCLFQCLYGWQWRSILVIEWKGKSGGIHWCYLVNWTSRCSDYENLHSRSHLMMRSLPARIARKMGYQTFIKVQTARVERKVIGATIIFVGHILWLLVIKFWWR